MRIVVDTNVFVAAVSSPDGASREILRRCLLGRYEPLMAQALIAEYESLLARSGPFVGSPTTEDERRALWGALASRCQWVRIYYLWRPNLSDEADNHLVELAIAGGAEKIVTSKFDATATDWKKSGFTFVGSTICYALVQAAGLGNE